MDIETLAKRAEKAMNVVNSQHMFYQHGVEVMRGFFNIYNDEAGQSKTVIYHPRSGYVFKTVSDYYGGVEPSNSRRYLGEVDFDGKVYRVRLPEFYIIGDVEVQEYVYGQTCCESQRGWCEHAHIMSDTVHCDDAHGGNYRIVGDEIVLFDFDGIDLDE